jgi:chromosome segregation protein
MFLKRIELNGFKSFADKSVINFDHNVTGVVGPNGCGKSNITDAIRWVLGEQSAKSLRGEKMTDVIFSGSIDRKKVNMAEVTLVFDNADGILHHDAAEVEITRRIFANNQPGEYLINHNNVRLKDVVELIMDTGIGKDSLSMITQGNITEFAEAKPVDRRGLFEEAAGVSKYKKRKMESLNKLVRTNDNLERTEDILNELERQVTPLKRQATKAEKYREKKTRLEQIEIAVLVNEIITLEQDIESCKKELFEIETSNTMHSTSIQVHENTVSDLKNEYNSLEKEINSLQEKLMRTINEIQKLENSKTELDEKRKYAIEVGTNEEKAKQLKSLVEDSRMEYLDRENRLKQINIDIELLSSQLSNVAMEVMNFGNEKDTSRIRLNKYENRIEVLKNLIENPFSNNAQQGVRAVMDNRNYLRGVLGVVGQELKPVKDYEVAISTSLGGAIYNIVTDDDRAARNAIDFLKKNRSGRATFLPKNVLKERYVSREAEIICENFDGFEGFASEFVECDEIFELVNASLLNNIIICDTLENGNKLSTRLHQKYKIVTIDGDIIHKGGAMTGGKTKQSSSIMTIRREYDDLQKTIESYRAKYQLATRKFEEENKKKTTLENNLQNKRINRAQLEPVLEAKKAKYGKLKNDLEVRAPNHNLDLDSDESFDDSIIRSLNEAYQSRDELTNNIKSKRELRIAKGQEKDRTDKQIRQIRNELEASLNAEKTVVGANVKLETKLENNLARLASEYQMTYEYAKEKLNDTDTEATVEEVIRLRNEIAALGNVNMNAPEEYSEINERFEFIKKNYDELVNSRDQILRAIDDMDEIMKKQFLEMFNKINGELNNTFNVLFGGGKARLILEDPNDLLNTGIDIDVQPPGKSVKSIRLFSGGEKTLIAICVLFTILKVRPVPLVIFDEVEAALDQANVERFAKYIQDFSTDTQFIVVSHRPGTMVQCDVLFGVTMQHLGVSQMMKVELVDAIELADDNIKEVL